MQSRIYVYIIYTVFRETQPAEITAGGVAWVKHSQSQTRARRPFSSYMFLRLTVYYSILYYSILYYILVMLHYIYICVYIYIYIHICRCIIIYIYIYIMHTLDIHIYIYIYTRTYIDISHGPPRRPAPRGGGGTRQNVQGKPEALNPKADKPLRISQYIRYNNLKWVSIVFDRFQLVSADFHTLFLNT